MLIKACLNGSRERKDHVALPITAEELADAAREAVDAGAGAIHIHPRRADETQSLSAEDVGAAITAIRAACPGIPVGVTTAAWVEPNPARRLDLVRHWFIFPDFASVNFSEPGTAELCAALFEVGVGVEAGLATANDVQLLLNLGLANRCIRLLIEPDGQDLETVLENVRQIEALLDAGGTQAPRLLHGVDAVAWPLLELALDRGYHTRIGFEDTLTLPDGSLARSNAQLVRVAREMATRAGRI